MSQTVSIFYFVSHKNEMLRNVQSFWNEERRRDVKPLVALEMQRDFVIFRRPFSMTSSVKYYTESYIVDR